MSQPVITEVITDADYPALETPEMKVVKHQLWPVSWIASDGSQIDAIWTFSPGGGQYVSGEPFWVETLHPVEMPDTARAAKIAALKDELAKLESESEQ